MEKKILVSDMHCEHCVKRISYALDQVNIKHEIDLKAQTVTVFCEDSQFKEAFNEIYDLGFTPKEV